MLALQNREHCSGNKHNKAGLLNGSRYLSVNRNQKEPVYIFFVTMASVLLVWKRRFLGKCKASFMPVCYTEMMSPTCHYVRCHNTGNHARVKVEYPELQEQKFAKYRNYPDIRMLQLIRTLLYLTTSWKYLVI